MPETSSSITSLPRRGSGATTSGCANGVVLKAFAPFRTEDSRGRARLVSGPMRSLRLLAPALAACLLAGCAGSSTRSSATSPTTSVPAYVREPFTAQQRRVAAGARLIVSEGCSVCHLDGSSSRLGPNFEHFAGHSVTLADGRRSSVNEAFLRTGLLHPDAHALKGYDAAIMVRALARLHLAEHPREVSDLAAFIEQIGPEPG